MLCPYSFYSIFHQDICPRRPSQRRLSAFVRIHLSEHWCLLCTILPCFVDGSLQSRHRTRQTLADQRWLVDLQPLAFSTCNKQFASSFSPALSRTSCAATPASSFLTQLSTGLLLDRLPSSPGTLGAWPSIWRGKPTSSYQLRSGP